MTARSIAQTPQGWDAAVEDYDQYLSPFFALFAEDVLRSGGVQPGHRVLDVAAGPGTLTSLAAQRGATVIATDFSPGMIARLRRRVREAGLPHVTAEVMDGQALTLPGDGFDAAFSIFGLIFSPDRAAGFRELHRVVRPGGKAAVAAWSTNAVNITRIIAEAKRQLIPSLPASPPSRSLQDAEGFAHEMRAAGFAAVEIQTVVHRWERPTAETVWEAMRANPAMIAGFPADRQMELRTRVIEGARTQFGPGPVPVQGEAYIGVGTNCPATSAAAP